MSFVPENIASLVDAAGTDTVLAFLEAYGGKQLYVSQQPDNGPVARMFGDDLAAIICRDFGPGWWTVPMCKAWRVLCYRNQGITISEIATRTGLSVRHIYAILQSIREKGLRVAPPKATRGADERQISLF